MTQTICICLHGCKPAAGIHSCNCRCPIHRPGDDESRMLLEAHRSRTIRAFLRAPDPSNHETTRVFDAFWAVVFADVDIVEHGIAAAVAATLERSTRKVGELIDGAYRPVDEAREASA